MLTMQRVRRERRGRATLYIPKKLVLPGDYVVTVTQLRPMAMKAKHGEFYDGMFDRDTQTVDLTQSLSNPRKWWVLGQLFKDDVIAAWADWMAATGRAKP